MNINVNEIINEVLYRYNFLGSVFASIEIVEDYNCYEYHGNPSASASKTKISYHPDFLSSLDREEQITLFAHEACHILLKHHQRSKGKNPRIWNEAADAVINANLKRDHFKPIEGMVDRPDAMGYSAERYYQKLLKEQEEQNKNQSQNSENNNQEKNEKNQNPSSQDNNEQSNQNSQSNYSNSTQQSEDYKKYDVGHDTHSNWYTDEYDLEESEKENENNKETPEQKSSETEEIDDAEVFSKNRKQQKERLENLRKNLVKSMLEAGKNTNSENLVFDYVGEKTNFIKWQSLLLDSTKIEEDWSFQNATIEYGVVTPHLEEQPQPETEILIDTSGSVNNNLVRNFLRECKSLLHTSKIRVGCFDTKFYGFQEIRSEEDIDNFIITGRGGTDFNAAVEAFTGRAENKIIFTDGCANMPHKKINVIWIVYGNQKINPEGGKVIYIPEDQLQKLNIVTEEKQRRR